VPSTRDHFNLTARNGPARTRDLGNRPPGMTPGHPVCLDTTAAPQTMAYQTRVACLYGRMAIRRGFP
jgi:hypothetical protein